MFSITNFFNAFLFKFLTAFFTAFLALPSLPSGTGKALPKASEDFTPVVRFAVVSDVHLNGNADDQNAVHFVNMFNDMYAYSESSSYNKIDALVVCGDMTGGGRDEEYALFNRIIEDNIKEETQLLAVLGNHEFIEYRDTDPTVGYQKFKQYVNEDVDRHLVIGGYHFIGVSYDDDAHHFSGKKSWLKEQLDAACKDTPDKPVFVFNHPHPFATVYGSVNWSDFDLRLVLSQYPQVINFSGHSHYAANDPRSIWQESFTAVGTGCLAAQMSNLDYTSGGEDVAGESGSFWIVEGDADGNVRLKLYDVVSHCFFEEADYYLENTNFLTGRRYTWNNLKSLDTAPKFPEGATIYAEKDDEGNVIISYPDAAGYYPAESYKIIVGSEISGTYDSNYARAVRDGVHTNVGKLDTGTYEVQITPYSPYAKAGNTILGVIAVD